MLTEARRPRAPVPKPGGSETRAAFFLQHGERPTGPRCATIPPWSRPAGPMSRAASCPPTPARGAVERSRALPGTAWSHDRRYSTPLARSGADEQGQSRLDPQELNVLRRAGGFRAHSPGLGAAAMLQEDPCDAHAQAVPKRSATRKRCSSERQRTGNEGEESSPRRLGGRGRGEATSMKLKHILVVLGAALFLAACSTVESPRSSSDSPTVRCGEGPGRGQSLSDTRPLFFLFCTQAP